MLPWQRHDRHAAPGICQMGHDFPIHQQRIDVVDDDGYAAAESTG
jgi:hypothetical protein